MGSPESFESAMGRVKTQKRKALATTIITGAELGVAWFFPPALYGAAVTGGLALWHIWLLGEAKTDAKNLAPPQK